MVLDHQDYLALAFTIINDSGEPATINQLIRQGGRDARYGAAHQYYIVRTLGCISFRQRRLDNDRIIGRKLG